MGFLVYLLGLALSAGFAYMTKVDLFHVPLDVLDYATGFHPVVGNLHEDMLGLVAALIFWGLVISFVWNICTKLIGFKYESTVDFNRIFDNLGLFMLVVIGEELVCRGFFSGLLGNMAPVANLGVHVGASLFALAHIFNFKGDAILGTVPMLIGHYFSSYLMAFMHATLPNVPFGEMLGMAVSFCIIEHLLFDGILLLSIWTYKIFAEE